MVCVSAATLSGAPAATLGGAPAATLSGAPAATLGGARVIRPLLFSTIAVDRNVFGCHALGAPRRLRRLHVSCPDAVGLCGLLGLSYRLIDRWCVAARVIRAPT